MKKLALLALSLLALNTFTYAQKGGKTKSELPPKEQATKTTENMGKKLGLDQAQKNKIIEAKTARITAIRDLNAKYGKSRKDHKEEYKAVMMKYKTDVKSTLNPEQYAKWEEHNQKKMKEKKEKMLKNKDNPKAPKTDEIDTEDFMIED